MAPYRKGARLFGKTLKQAIHEFSEQDIINIAAALGYYTIFSLPPMVLILITIFTSFYNEVAFEKAVYEQIGNLAGSASARQLAVTVEKMGLWQDNWWSTFIGIATLLVTSTTVFVTIQNSLNTIFHVKPKPKGWGILKLIRDRLLSFAFILVMGFIMLVSLSINALLVAFNSYLSDWLPNISIFLMTISSVLLPLIITTLLFAAIFKFLPDAHIRWRYSLKGALITAILFALGKDFIGFYIGNSPTATLYEAAGSVMVIMLWVFYASVIFLFGATFTASYIRLKEGAIPPKKYAIKVIKKEMSLDDYENED